MQLSKPLSDLLAPLFEALPLDKAMPELVPGKAQGSQISGLVAAIENEPALQKNKPLLAGIWLYVDDLDRSHQVSQSIETPIGSLWHGIMHRREGDFWNSKYWFRRAGTEHVLVSMDPGGFVDRVEQTYKNNPPDLLAQQRKEWETLFQFCAKEATE